MGKMVIIHHKGDDIRGTGEGLLSQRFSDRILVSTPDLLEWSEDAIWVPNPIDLNAYPNVGVAEHSGPIKIVHAPSDRKIKGTKYVIRAVKEMQREGYPIELILVENTPFKIAKEIYMSADIIIDQLLVGWYGNFAIEGMALGKPVCAYIREDLASYLGDAPIINIESAHITDTLKALVEDPSCRRSLGSLGRAYAERRHSSDRIAEYMLNEIYNESS